MKPKIVIVLGPTAIGKSELALELAQNIDGEIVNADSQQVYRCLDIGTGKPSTEERLQVPHHLIDVVDPDEEFNAAQFRRMALKIIEEIQGRKKTVIVCGGTGLYLKALTQGLFDGPGQDAALRAALERQIESEGLPTLYQRLVAIDGSVISTIHPNDRQRIIRALEVFEATGRPLSAWQNEHAFRDQPFAILKLGLLRERAELYDRINHRSEQMVRDGLLEEVEGLVARGYSLDLKALRSVGYRQMGEVLRGEKDLTGALEEMKQETRRLAKRQLTWFRRDREIEWFHPDKQRQEIFRRAKEFLR
ncbi:MAG: tRNA (adenosine(37)-N6)-dimethylallyltransferase MiaA [Chloroflexota bacterium]